jgi:hypothetical protein
VRIRRTIFLTGMASMLGASTLIGATSIQAATTITITDADCTTGSLTGSPITASPGDVLDITTNLAGCDQAAVGLNLVASSASIDAVYTSGGPNINTGVAAYTVSGGVGATFTRFRVTLGSWNGTEQITLSDGLTGDGVTWDVTITSGGGSGGGGSSSDSSSAPAPVVQQFGKPTTGTCDEATSEDLNWSDVASGGWSESWAQWMNGGNGGAVCTRTLVYSTVQSRWIVG